MAETQHQSFPEISLGPNIDRMQRATLALLVLSTVLLPGCLAAQILETETARPLRAGQLEIAAGYELQESREGSEIAIPFAFELGLTNRLGLLVEPVPYTSIQPEIGSSTTGAG